jgi:hypothetical protein
MMVEPGLIGYIAFVERAKECVRLGIQMLIEVPNPWKRPKGFPRGRLACINAAGCQARYVSPKKVLAYCKKLEKT